MTHCIDAHSMEKHSYTMKNKIRW